MDWQKKVSLWWAKNFRPLVVALLVGCGVHYTIYANQLGTMDAVHIGALYIADGWPEHLYWETEQGRWALRLVDMLRGGINQPALSALLMLFLYALAGVLLTDLFGVRSRTAKYLIPLTLVCAPYVAEIEFFHYCSVSYALSFLLAVLAVQSAVCGLRFAWLAGTVCMAFSLGMYQANLGTAAGLCVMLLILAVLRRHGAWKATGLTALRMVLMGGSGAVLYMLILKVFLRLYDVGLSGVNGINAVGLDTLRSLPLGLKNAYFDFYAYFFTHGIAQNHYGQIAGYLLLFGQLPTPEQLEQFCAVLGECRTMPTNFTRDVIMKAPSHDIMNSMARSVLTLASYDPKAADLDTANVLRQSIQLAGIFPMLAVYSYHAYNHYEKDASMYIHRPDPSLSTAENFLRMLRPDMQYTPLEARVLDVALLLHAEHGGGNNSTFTTRVVTSSGTDTYSAMAAALCSLKGPRHGGANLMVMHMMQNIRDNLHDIEDDEELEAYLKKLLHGEAFDRKGLIYGMGHAVYSLSDPREVVFKGYVEQLAHEKGRDKDLSLYTRIERMAPQLIAQERKIFKGVSPNVDFYSGFVYEMLGIPMELYTPLFAVARVMGWSAHRIEELLSANKIIRPAYKSLGGTHDYIPRSQRA